MRLITIWIDKTIYEQPQSIEDSLHENEEKQETKQKNVFSFVRFFKKLF